MKKILFIIVILLTGVLIFDGCSKEKQNSQQQQKKVYYTCTMHPQVISDKPGVCPICQMELVKKVSDDIPAEKKEMQGMVTLDGNKQSLANVSTVTLRKENLQKEITAYSYLDFAEQNRKTISARFSGRIEKFFVNKSGDYIKKGAPLFSIYSPDLVQAQNDLIIARRNTGSANLQNNALARSIIKKLELYGLTAEQIKKIESSDEAQQIITFYSPASGTVIEKKIQEGMYVTEGTAIYDIADLSTLWNITEVRESDLGSIKLGANAVLHLQAYPAEEFKGKVSFIYPVINAQTRTVKIRSEFANRNNKLKPQMYGQTIFRINNGQGILVPENAIVFSGNRQTVWVKVSDGMFEARSVQLGEKYGSKYRVLSGLNEGDEVAASGGFLIDSESQLKNGNSSDNNGTAAQNSSGSKKKASSMDNMPGM
jgi:membrane fusion protein, copper/silver efflux system